MLNVIIDPNAAWMADALCAGETTFTEWEHTERLAWCRICPVRETCASWEPYGFWGATGEAEAAKPPASWSWCKRGHDLAVVGVTKHNRCRACRRVQQSEYERRRYARAKAERGAA